MRTGLVWLDERHTDATRVLVGTVSLAEGQRRSVETITRVASWRDQLYGQVDITPDKLGSMVRNFDARVYGQDIPINLAHNDAQGAAGFIRSLSFENGRLRGEIEWTPLGVQAVTQDGFRYFSAEYHENWKDPETEQAHGPTLLGAALTVRPRVKRLDPINPENLLLAEGNPAVAPQMARFLSEEITTMWKELLKRLADTLRGLKLHESVVTSLVDSAEAALQPLTDETTAKALAGHFEATGKALAEQIGGQPATVNLTLPGTKVLSDDDMRAAVQRLLDERAAKDRESQQAHAALRAEYTAALEAWDGWKGLSDDQRRQLAEAGDLIAPGMSSEQVKRLAEHQIKLGNELQVAAQLAARGWPGAQGVARISVSSQNEVKSLQESVDRRLGLLDMAPARRYERVGGQVPDVNKALVERVLAEFDAERGAQLHAEHRMLAGGDGIVSDVALPVIWERTVIREALYNLVGLQFVDVGTMTFAVSGMIPYSYRDTAAASLGSTRRYEGQAISRAGVIQTADTVYPIPQKLAFEVSDELRYLTSNGQLNWEAVAENQRNASRIIGEDTEQMIFNEVLRASDEYGATAITNENLELQADGTKRVFVTSKFPVVRPRKVYDLQGNAVGSTVNPVTVTYNSVALAEYDGTGTQAAGTYYVLNYNFGEIYLVNQAGAIQTPADGTAYTLSYSWSPNAYAFDTDVPSGVETAVHWDGLLYRYGLRKSVIEDGRYHMANFGLMSGTAMTQVEQARQFGANSMRAGTDLQANGNLGRVKDVPNFKTAAPGLWMGDQRIVIGERGVTRFRMMKPWTMGELENQKDSNGRFTGKKEAYGDQFVVLHTPTPLKRAYTSLVLYSATARVARVNP